MSLLTKIRQSKTAKSLALATMLTGATYMAQEALIPKDAYATASSKAHVEAQENSQKQADVKYETVDDILGDTFKPVSTDSYDEAIKSGENVVVLFYDTNGMNSPTEWMAHVFKEVAPEFKDSVKFYKFENDSDPSLNDNHYQGFRNKLGIYTIPSYQLFKNGKKVFTNKGGPLQNEIEESIGRTTRNMEELINTK